MFIQIGENAIMKIQFPISASALSMIWLGQAGFLFSLPSGRTVLLDPYLSDSVYLNSKAQSGYAYKRMAAAPFSAQELAADEIFCSHEHGDHLDVGSISALMSAEKTRLYTNPISARSAADLGVRKEQIHILTRNSFVDFGEYCVQTLPAQHGDMAPEAMGFLFNFGGYRVYYAGDTAFDPVLLKQTENLQPNLALLPINGEYGNMNACEAADFARFCGAMRCIPYHFWTFPRHGGDPMSFCKELPERAPGCELILLTPGEPLLLA